MPTRCPGGAHVVHYNAGNIHDPLMILMNVDITRIINTMYDRNINNAL